MDRTAFAAGITGGCGGGNYCPDAPVTRGQMAVFLPPLSVCTGRHKLDRFVVMKTPDPHRRFFFFRSDSFGTDEPVAIRIENKNNPN